MARLFRRASKKAGLPPGTPVHIGPEKTAKVKVTVIDYDADTMEEREVAAVDECMPYKDKSSVTWINVDGIHQVDIVESLGNAYDLHPLLLEDVLSTDQRPKMEEFDDYVYIVVKMLYLNKDGDIESEQISIILGKSYVITFQEKEGDVFDPIRKRLREDKGRVRRFGADYLAYCLLDGIVDSYFAILESIGERTEELEQEVITEPEEETLQDIHRMKREIIMFRKTVWPLRDVANVLCRGDSPLFKKQTLVYLRDVYDHTIRVIDTTETYRDIVSGLLDIYLSSMSNKMNEVMKVLTIIATIFIPLGFFAGVYGMNFKYMPELEWRYGYHTLLALMFTVGLLMLVYFRKKKWI